MPDPKEERAADASSVPVPNQGFSTGASQPAGVTNQSPAQASTALFANSVQSSSVPVPGPAS
eukprot:6165836-Amphidinium_carterae.1